MQAKDYKDIFDSTTGKNQPKIPVAAVEKDKALDSVEKTPEELAAEQKVLDDAKLAEEQAALDSAALDMVETPTSGASYAVQNLTLRAAAAIQVWAETTDDKLDDGEGLGDRLFGLLAGIADENMDGEITDEEAEVLALAVNAAGDYLSAHGIASEDVSTLLANFDNDVAATVKGQITLPEGEDAQSEEIEHFTFADGSTDSALDAADTALVAAKAAKDTAQEAFDSVSESDDTEAVATAQTALDSAQTDLDAAGTDVETAETALDAVSADAEGEVEHALDATYKKKLAVRGGKKVWVKKRIAGKVRLSGKQKIGIAKAGRKAHSAKATMRRAKSMKISRRISKK